MQLSKYNKFWVALGVALSVLGAALSDGKVTQAELFQIISSVLGSLGVYHIANK